MSLEPNHSPANMKPWGTVLLSLGPVDTLGWIHLLWGCPVHQRMLSISPGLCPLAASSTPHQL